MKTNEVLKKVVNIYRSSYTGYVPNPAATNFPTSAKSVMPGVFSFFDLYMAKPVSWGVQTPVTVDLSPLIIGFLFSDTMHGLLTKNNNKKRATLNPQGFTSQNLGCITAGIYLCVSSISEQPLHRHQHAWCF